MTAPTNRNTGSVRILYWLVAPVGSEAIIKGVQFMPGTELLIVHELSDVLAKIAECDALILGDVPPAKARAVVDAARAIGSRLRRLHFVSAGREGFDAVEIPDGIAVSGPKGASAPALAEHAMALLLALGRRIPDAVENALSSEWNRSIAHDVRSVEGQTMVIVGLGHAGREVATRARSFGMRTIGVARDARRCSAVDAVVSIDDLAGVLAEADAVVLTVALTERTERLFDAAMLSSIKPGALLVNVSRGRVIDHAALVEALESGALAGVGLDVTDPEPLPEGHALWDIPTALITPHYAGAGSLTGQRTASRALEMIVELTDEIARTRK